MRTKSEPELERVYTVHGYYDGPREGVANFQGMPHVYSSRYRDFSGQRDSFQLMPINEEALRLILEDWEIWKRWLKAFNKGRATLDTHPALPEERHRHEELKPAVEAAMAIVEANSIEASGEFLVREGDYWVSWETLASA